MNKSPVLSIRDVRKSYRESDGSFLEIINIKTFDLAEGQQIALVGSSGSGKSTLLNLIAGILLPDCGDIIISGENITRLSEAKRDRFRAAHVGYIFQSFNLLQGFTALENVQLGLMFSNGQSAYSEERKQVLPDVMLERVGLKNRLHHKPRALSVGEQQRVAIARALVNAPPLVLADEPTGSLDQKNGQAVLELLKKVCGESNHTLLVVTHDPHVMEQFETVVRLEELRNP